MPRPADHKAVVDTFIDEELDTQKLTERTGSAAVQMADRMMSIVKKALAAGVQPDELKRLLREAWIALFFNTYVAFAEDVMSLTDANVVNQIAAIKKFGKPLDQLSAIIDEDVKARAAEKAGL